MNASGFCALAAFERRSIHSSHYLAVEPIDNGIPTSKINRVVANGIKLIDSPRSHLLDTNE